MRVTKILRRLYVTQQYRCIRAAMSAFAVHDLARLALGVIQDCLAYIRRLLGIGGGSGVFTAASVVMLDERRFQIIKQVQRAAPTPPPPHTGARPLHVPARAGLSAPPPLAQLGEGGYAYVYLVRELPSPRRPRAGGEPLALKRVRCGPGLPGPLPPRAAPAKSAARTRLWAPNPSSNPATAPSPARPTTVSAVKPCSSLNPRQPPRCFPDTHTFADRRGQPRAHGRCPA